MSRRHVSFDCEGARLVGTLDEGSAASGLLIVSGGNEVRAGAWNGQALLAARIAERGYPVFRFDRRGIGDSEGENGEFRSSAPDIASALAAFHREQPSLQRVVALGNCDAASALALTGGEGFDTLLLSNPWTIDDEAAPPPPAVIRDHYKQRLRDPEAIKRLLKGEVSLGKLASSLRDALRKPPPPPPAPEPDEPAKPEFPGLLGEMARGIDGFSGDLRFLIAERDRTAQVFLAHWGKLDPRLRFCAGGSHSYVEPEARAWLEAQVLDVL